MSNAQEPLVGWKSMKFYQPGWIVSEITKEVLPGRERWEARCAHPENVVHRDNMVIPHPSCTCGFYAWRSQERRSEYGGPLYVKLAMWGHVIEATGGFRSEFAYPLEIDVVEGTEAAPYVFLLQHRYGVPCRLVPKESWSRPTQAAPPVPQLTTRDLLELFINPLIVGDDRIVVARALRQRLHGMEARAKRRVYQLVAALKEARDKSAELTRLYQSVRECIAQAKKERI